MGAEGRIPTCLPKPPDLACSDLLDTVGKDICKHMQILWSLRPDVAHPWYNTKVQVVGRWCKGLKGKPHLRGDKNRKETDQGLLHKSAHR